MTRSPSRLLRRWDIDATTRTSLPFERGVALVNLRRIELASMLELGTNALQSLLGLGITQMIVASIVAITGLLVARRARRWSLVPQHLVIAAFLVVALALKQWGAVVFAHAGRVSTGYAYTLLTLTLLFILPPRLLALLLAVFFASYCAIILRAPLPTVEQGQAIANTGIVSIIALVAGALIFAARRSDHEQRSIIQSQNDQLAVRNDELDQLMAITAHDLRSPLHGMRNLFDLVERRAGTEPHLPLQAIRDGIFSLNAMIALVTRLLRAHAAEHEPIAAPVRGDVREQLAAAVRRIAPQAAAAGVPIELSVPATPLWASFDEAALEQILDNLLSNAVRFSGADQPVVVHGSAVAGRTRVTVTDRGPGVAAEMRATLFQKYSRGPDQRAGGKPSTGMGLFIAAQLARRIRADLRYRDGERTGAVFELSLGDAAR